MSDETNKRIGDYEILGVLGSGGMGRVFKVRNTISDRVEAMKILLPDLAGQQEVADRFLREIKLLAALNHPNIASLRTALTVNNQLVMIMEYVEGTTLAACVERGPIPVPDALNYIDQALAGLSYAHAQGVVHRDMKPSNMMLTPQGVVKVMDFGIARSGTDRSLTSTGTTLGSLYYMSPEQIRGEKTDARSDLYSVGVSLYEMVSGQCPFQADSDFSIMAAHLQKAPKPPIDLQASLPPALNEIILMAMAKEPERRFQSANAFRKALSNVTGVAVPAVQHEVMPVAPQVSSSASDPTVGAVRVAAPTAALNLSDPSNAPTATNTPSPLKVAAPQTPPPPMPPTAPSHRGLYMAIGAVIALIAIVAAAMYIPRRASTHAVSAVGSPAAGTGTGASSANSAPASTPATGQADTAGATGATPAPTTTTPSDTTPSAPTLANSASFASGGGGGGAHSAGHGKGQASAQLDAQQNAAQQQEAAAAAAAAAEAAKELEELEKQEDQLSSRSGAVNSSLDTLRHQQESQGYGLRGDIASLQQSMNSHLQKAQSAIQNQDVRNAKRYLDQAENEMSSLERFLGR
jgi:serine/threonine-protein kinase